MRPSRLAALVAATAAVSTAATLTATTATTATSGPDPRRAVAAQAQLVGRSVLPAETYVPDSEPSGYFQTGTTAVERPYPGQPVQGFSATHRLRDGSYLVMSDNGYGTKANSADYQLAVHQIRPSTQTGVTAYLGTRFVLRDPDRHITWPIWRDGACAATESLPDGYTCTKRDRILTGWDFDVESMQVAPDGTFWFGEEFGPFLLHADHRGRLLSAPVPTPGVKSPQNPSLQQSETPNLAGSKGFEGMAISPNGERLHPMLEGPVAEDTARGLASDLRIYDVPVSVRRGAEFDGSFWRYRMEHPGNAIGDLIALNDYEFLVLERDSGSGPTARFKTIFKIDVRDHDRDGYVDKELLSNLMAVPDPDGVGGSDAFFTFPFVTIEDVEILDRQTVAVMNDNNFPATGGRSATEPDENEYLKIRLDQPLDVDRRLLARG